MEISKSNSGDKQKDYLVIAHRGTTFWAPEETEAAMRWARNIGAHYLELDLQRTKDGFLIALHDEDLNRTTDVAQKFPERKNAPVSSFTYEELLTLDAGTWFNTANPKRSRSGFIGLDILTLEDVIRIAEGKKIKRSKSGQRVLNRTSQGLITTEYEDDPEDNGNRPGIYVETKVPALFPGIEADLKKELIRLGWYNQDLNKLKEIAVRENKVSIANSQKRLILQTFSKESLTKLNQQFTDYVPICFLLWRGESHDDIKDDRMSSYFEWIWYGKNHGATIIGPSISGAPNNYSELLTKDHAFAIKEAGLQIHAYSFDTWEQMEKYEAVVDGMFTNKAEEALMFVGRKSKGKNTETIAEKTLDQLGYAR